jgi:CBS-domain-containing membrane protein
MLLTALIVVAYASGLQAMAAPFCATCALLALMPNAPFSSPRTLWLSHLVCIGSGVLFAALPLPTLLAVLLAAWLSITAMSLLRVVHAPAVAHTVILSLGMQQTFVYAIGAFATALGFALFTLIESRQRDAKSAVSEQ